MAVRTALLVPVALLGAAALLGGCRTRYYEAHYARVEAHAQEEAPTQGRVIVRVARARVIGGRVVVSTLVENRSNSPMVVSRRDVGLRLPDGSVVPGEDRRGRGPLVIAPGSSKRVRVHFRAPRGTNVLASHLVWNNVRFGDSEPLKLGDVAMAKGLRVFGLGSAPVDDAEQPASPPPVESSDSNATDLEGEDVDDAGAEAEGPADDGSWQVGGGK